MTHGAAGTEEEGAWRAPPPVRQPQRPLSSLPIDRHNRTGHSHHTLPESSDYGSMLVSPVLVACVVIGMVIAISCVTIIVGSLCWGSQGGAQQSRHRRREFEDSQDSEESSYSSHGAHNACSLGGEWPPPTDLSPGEEANAMVLRELYTDSPPCYEECTGPGATQRYLPTDAPPPYLLTDTNPGSYQQGQSGPRTISVDALPTYEAACEIHPPSGLLPLPGPEPGPQSPPGSPERVV
ncbi:protein BEAN1 [Artibeus jamaicensis]|uniref:protein BEAN1 n=1 Tax=Artibeus jamaicensis TaxID=9417 RepID=UPI00235AD2C0|nr:protein BEAN1 [Artibeus jamaicensis]